MKNLKNQLEELQQKQQLELNPLYEEQKSLKGKELRNSWEREELLLENHLKQQQQLLGL